MGLYKQNKAAKCGTEIECPVCHRKFIKRQYSQAFCSTKCKDKFHNHHNPDRHRYTSESSIMTDHDWDDMFGVAEYR